MMVVKTEFFNSHEVSEEFPVHYPEKRWVELERNILDFKSECYQTMTRFDRMMQTPGIKAEMMGSLQFVLQKHRAGKLEAGASVGILWNEYDPGKYQLVFRFGDIGRLSDEIYFPYDKIEWTHD